MAKEKTTKTVLITGSSSGIGQATAYRFAQAGSNLIITYHQNQSEGENTVKECLRLGAKKVKLVKLDLANDSSFDNILQTVLADFNQIDILVNNAGVLMRNKLVDQSFFEIDSQIKINLASLMKITKIFLPYIKESIINIGSNLGIKGKGKLAAYSATKFGVRGFSQALSQELPGIRVYAVNPTLTATKMGGPEGLPAAKVADIIYNAAVGNYQAKSGSDINVIDYQYGEFFGRFFGLLRFLKNLI
ncbi:MAG: SDR family oxidoreductase [Patescibacteria group bacterium]